MGTGQLIRADLEDGLTRAVDEAHVARAVAGDETGGHGLENLSLHFRHLAKVLLAHPEFAAGLAQLATQKAGQECEEELRQDVADDEEREPTLAVRTADLLAIEATRGAAPPPGRRKPQKWPRPPASVPRWSRRMAAPTTANR